MIRALVSLSLLCTISACSSDDSTPSNGGGGSGATGGAGNGGASTGGSGGSTSGGSGATGGATGGASTGGSGGSTSGGSGGTGGTGGAMKTYLYMAIGDGGALKVYGFDDGTAALTPVDTVTVGTHNSFGAFHPNKQFFYAVDEYGSTLRAYSINAADGKLTFLNDAATEQGPVYAVVDSTGKYLLTASYTAGKAQVFALNADGTLGDAVDTETTGNAAHSINLSPDNEFAFVPNKDSNNVSVFAFDAASGALTGATPVGRAGGPRHMAFHPTQPNAYIVNETSNTVTAFGYGAGSGSLSEIESVPLTSQDDEFDQDSGADVHVTPDGKYLYGTNRNDGTDTITAYSIGGDGKLTQLEIEETQGSAPRNFAIHPNGELVIVANHGSANVATFRIQADGKLELIEATDIGANPYWVGFLQLPQ